jgi:hypothetical protein
VQIDTSQASFAEPASEHPQPPLRDNDSAAAESSDEFVEPPDAPKYANQDSSSDEASEDDCVEVDLRPAIAQEARTSGLQLDANTLAAKCKSWRNATKKRYSTRRKFGYSEQQKESLPPEVLRKIIKDHGDMSSKRFR